MNRLELIEAIVKETGVTKKQADAMLKAYTETVIKAVKKGDRVQLVGFGTFEQRKRAARKAKNPKTGETIKVPASKVPAFKPGKSFKDAVNTKRAKKK